MDDVRIGEVLKPVDADETGRREKRVRLEFWRTAKRAARHVPFMDELVAAYYCALDPKTPFRVRGTLLAALAYFVLPLDFIPDFLVGFGFTDDVAVGDWVSIHWGWACEVLDPPALGHLRRWSDHHLALANRTV